MHLIVIVDDIIKYEHCFHLNGKLSGVEIFPVINKGGKNISEEYNQSISRILKESGLDDWVMFCPDCAEILSEPGEWIGKLDPQYIWGVSGYLTVKNMRGKTLCEHIGVIQWREDSGKAYAYGLESPESTPVDALSFNTLLVHSSLLRKYGLNFDPALSKALFNEDFCLTALKKHQIQSKIFHMPLLFHMPVENLGRELQSEGSEYFKTKHSSNPTVAIGDATVPTVSRKIEKPYEKKGVYHYNVEKDQYNRPCVAALPFMRDRAKVLDVGCAYGDVGAFFQQQLDAVLWGMEYDPDSIAHAAKRGIYQELMQVDLDAFDVHSFSKYYQFFDQLFLGDILEHLRNPLAALEKLSLLLHTKGSMLVSLPNMAHNYVLGNLLDGRFDYDDCGLLDETHIRFFTWKTQAELFARAGLRVVNASVCFMGPNEGAKWTTPRNLPYSFYQFTHANKHFHVLQYISELAPAGIPYLELLSLNSEALRQAPENNEPGWRLIEHLFKKFEYELSLARGAKLPDDLQRQIFVLCHADRGKEALQLSGLFDAIWYLKEYPDVAAMGVDPFEHYYEIGWQEGKRPSEYFDPEAYVKNFPGKKVSGNPLLHYLKVGYLMSAKRVKPDPDFENLHCSRLAAQMYESDNKAEFVELATDKYQRKEGDPKLLAYYLPQFYPNPANDRWWEKGFTEWTNVTKAAPQYVGHYQPHLPFDLGFYDLRVTDVVKRQIELAKYYGLYGFCYHYYWFNGKKMLDMPVYRHLQDKDLDFPFSVSWANETWTSAWDGGNKNILVAQSDSINGDRLFKDLLPLFQDERYIKVEGKPVFSVYKPAFHTAEHFRAGMDRLRELAVKHGFPDLHIILVKRHPAPEFSLAEYGGDAYAEFPPHGLPAHRMDKHVLNPQFSGHIHDMSAMVDSYKQLPVPSDLTYRCIMPMRDNSPRRLKQGCVIFDNHSPELYEDWLKFVICETRRNNPPENNFVFINAWNEWAEGAHLEPDRRHGYAYLEATKQAIIKSRS